MSRVSRKSELSPSITKGSNDIDLGKNSSIDMGRKSQPSLTSGGVGVTQEVSNVGGMSVTGGVSVDISPIDFGVSADPSEGSISVSGGAGVPGGLLGVSGGVTIDTNTGEIIGGSIGGEIGGFGINISNSEKGGVGIEFTYQIGPIELSLGFGFPPKEPIIKPTPTPSPTPSPLETLIFPPPPPPLPLSGGNQICTIIVAREVKRWTVTKTGVVTFFINNSYGEVGRDPEGYKKISGYFYYKDNTFRGVGQEATNPFFNVYPSWLQTPLYDYFSYSLIFGVSGTENEVYKVINREAYYFDSTNYINETIYSVGTYTIIYSDCSIPTPPLPPPPPPPPLPPRSFPNPPPRRQKKMDACCRENLAFLRAIYTRLGLARFPGQLPNTIIQEVPKEGEQPAEPPQVPIPDLVSLLNWQFERDDERWGQWEVQINVKDADVTQEGDQGKSVKFPNLAESIAEIEGQMLSLTTNIDALVAITTKNLVESGLGRQEAIKSYLAAKSIIKYMAFKSTEIDVTVPICFTPGAETIARLITESEVHVKGLDYTEKETLRDVLLDLLQAAAVVRAVHWQRIDPKKDTKSQLLGLLKGTVDLANSINNPTKPTDGTESQPNPAQNFEDFIDSVEDGFRNSTGVTDVENPYGKNPSRRPRVRQVGDNISQAGRNN